MLATRTTCRSRVTDGDLAIYCAFAYSGNAAPDIRCIPGHDDRVNVSTLAQRHIVYEKKVLLSNEYGVSIFNCTTTVPGIELYSDSRTSTIARGKKIMANCTGMFMHILSMMTNNVQCSCIATLEKSRRVWWHLMMAMQLTNMLHHLIDADKFLDCFLAKITFRKVSQSKLYTLHSLYLLYCLYKLVDWQTCYLTQGIERPRIWYPPIKCPRCHSYNALSHARPTGGFDNAIANRRCIKLVERMP